MCARWSGVLGGRDGGPSGLRVQGSGRTRQGGLLRFRDQDQPTEDEVGLQVPAELTPQAEAAIRAGRPLFRGNRGGGWHGWTRS